MPVHRNLGHSGSAGHGMLQWSLPLGAASQETTEKLRVFAPSGPHRMVILRPGKRRQPLSPVAWEVTLWVARRHALLYKKFPSRSPIL